MATHAVACLFKWPGWFLVGLAPKAGTAEQPAMHCSWPRCAGEPALQAVRTWDRLHCAQSAVEPCHGCRLWRLGGGGGLSPALTSTTSSNPPTTDTDHDQQPTALRCCEPGGHGASLTPGSRPGHAGTRVHGTRPAAALAQPLSGLARPSCATQPNAMPYSSKHPPNEPSCIQTP